MHCVRSVWYSKKIWMYGLQLWLTGIQIASYFWGRCYRSPSHSDFRTMQIERGTGRGLDISKATILQLLCSVFSCHLSWNAFSLSVVRKVASLYQHHIKLEVYLQNRYIVFVPRLQLLDVLTSVWKHVSTKKKRSMEENAHIWGLDLI